MFSPKFDQPESRSNLGAQDSDLDDVVSFFGVRFGRDSDFGGPGPVWWIVSGPPKSALPPTPVPETCVRNPAWAGRERSLQPTSFLESFPPPSTQNTELHSSRRPASSRRRCACCCSGGRSVDGPASARLPGARGPPATHACTSPGERGGRSSRSRPRARALCSLEAEENCAKVWGDLGPQPKSAERRETPRASLRFVARRERSPAATATRVCDAHTRGKRPRRFQSHTGVCVCVCVDLTASP